jgi:Putative zinc-finger
MTARCTDLDLFFDGELETDQAAEFRNHLATCQRCQRVLHGRMQEEASASGNDVATAVTATALDDAAAAARITAVRQPARDAATRDAPAVVPAARKAGVPGCRRRRVLVYLAPVVAAAVALPLCRFGDRDDGSLELVQIEHSSTTRSTAHVGDTLRSTVRGARHRAIAVYFDKHDLRAACPGPGPCSDADGELVLRLTLREPGVYTVVGLRSDDEIKPPAPGKTLDEFLAQNAGVHCDRSTIKVDE